MTADRYERRHRRTAKNRHCVEVMANADFAAVPSLSEAMGLEEPAGPEVVDCRQHGNVPARVAALLDAGRPGHVRDLFEDMAAKLGEAKAITSLRAALAAYRMDCVFRRQAAWEPNVQNAQQLEEWLGEGRP